MGSQLDIMIKKINTYTASFIDICRCIHKQIDEC